MEAVSQATRGVPHRHLHRHCSLHCIIPPHVLENVAVNGNDRQRKSARAALEQDDEIRGERVLRLENVRPARWAAVLEELALFSLPNLQALANLQALSPNRAIFDANKDTRLPGRKVRGEGDPPTPDIAVNEAYDGLGATFALFGDEYGRNSIDNKGMRLDASVHYDKNYDNAFWDGRQMVFGDGDIFNRFTSSLDVIGHELTHGVIERTAGLIYWSQSGALNEHVADVFGSLVKQRERQQTVTEADWLIGAELVEGTGIEGIALRSMKNPGEAYDDPLIGRDPQPGHMTDYVLTADDQGGVHINSGIPNRAFYLAASNIGGFAWEEPGLVWYETLRGPFMRRIMKFRAFAWLTVFTATQLFGRGDIVPQAIYEAWREVGVLS